jgi:hypothetical protein
MNRLRLHVKRRAQPFGEKFCCARDGASERRNEIVTGFFREKFAFVVEVDRKKMSNSN